MISISHNNCSIDTVVRICLTNGLVFVSYLISICSIFGQYLIEMMRWSLISISHSTFPPSRLPSIPNETTSFYFTSPKKYMDLRYRQKETCFHLSKLKPISTVKDLREMQTPPFWISIISLPSSFQCPAGNLNFKFL